MAAFSTNTIVLPAAKPLLAKALAHLVAILTPTPKSPEDILAADQRREAARARVDHLLR